MNCCNHDCNQGRNCPVRIAPATPFDTVPPPGKLETFMYWLCIFLMLAIASGLVYAISDSGHIEFGCIK